MKTPETEVLTGNIIMTRIRLARNVYGAPFSLTDMDLSEEIIKNVSRSLVNFGSFDLYRMAELSEERAESMKEKHLISSRLMKNPAGAALIDENEGVSVMIGEEDVLREQCFKKGLCLYEVYDKLDRIDDEICKNTDIAFDKDLGFLTACTTNLGTGLRASVMMFLPALTESGKMNDLVAEMDRLGLTVRGLYGEGSDGEGYVYQISNEVTLGVTERDILDSVNNAVLRICEAERAVEDKLYGGKKQLNVMDKAKKSYGILTNAVLLDYNEFLKYTAQVKIGAILGLLPINDIDKIDDLIIKVRPYNLCVEYGRKLTETDEKLYRAETVGKELTLLKE